MVIWEEYPICPKKVKTSTGEKTADGKVAISKGIMPTAKPDMDMFMEKHILKLPLYSPQGDAGGSEKGYHPEESGG